MCRIAIGNGKGILNPIKLPLEEGFISICDKLAEKPAFQSFGRLCSRYVCIVILLVETESFLRFFAETVFP